jgi:hypothetical protein
LKANLTHLWSHPRILRVDFLSLKKLPQPGEFNDLFSGQDGAHQRLLRSRVNLIQMMLKRGFGHKLPYAFVKSAINYQIWTGAKGGTNTFVFE